VKLRYYRGFADKVQIALNGKQLASPPAPARGNIEFEINTDNVARILESGQIVPGEVSSQVPDQPAVSETTPAVATATPAVAASPPRPSPTSPRPAFTPASTPRRSPTPIIVGRPPGTRPWPN
jgi:hypothetical protein